MIKHLLFKLFKPRIFYAKAVYWFAGICAIFAAYM
jgi:hypothetical protein